MPTLRLNPAELAVISFPTQSERPTDLLVTPQSQEPGGCTAKTHVATEC